MKRCLILITSSYPYLTQESFLESEMPYDRFGFDKIITLAIDVSKGAPKMRAVPENVDCYNVAATSKRAGRYMAKAKGVLNYIGGSDYYELDEEADTLNRKLFLGYFVARAEREYKLCMEKLEKYDFSEYDSVTVYSYWFFVSALIGVKIKDAIKGQCKRVRLVSRAHRYDVYENCDITNKTGYLPLRAYLLNKYDAVYVCSENGRDHIRQLYPVFAHKVHKSYLGTIDNGICSIGKSGLHILSCSNVINIKRVERIAGSLSLLKDSGIDIKWTHIGDGSNMHSLKRIAEEKLGFMTVDFKGELSNIDVLNFYRRNNIDIFLNVSYSEGLPVSIMEAISFGVPVIATAVGGVKEIVKNNYNGRLIEKDFTDEDLAFELKKFYAMEPEEKNKMRKNARWYWEENFNAEKNYAEFVNNII